jgi:hypothetical protein
MNENVWEIPAVLCFLWIGVAIAMMVTWCLMDADKRAFHRLLRFKGPSFMLWNMEPEWRAFIVPPRSDELLLGPMTMVWVCWHP